MKRILVLGAGIAAVVVVGIAESSGIAELRSRP